MKKILNNEENFIKLKILYKVVLCSLGDFLKFFLQLPPSHIAEKNFFFFKFLKFLFIMKINT
jgi:hypothetical protein